MRITFLIFFWLYANSVFSQSVQGYIIEETPNKRRFAVSDAIVSTVGGSAYTITDSTGFFKLESANPATDRLVVSAFGFAKDTFDLNGSAIITISLQSLQLKEAVITVNRKEFSIASTDIISSADLVKDACCNLTEVFENSVTVDVSYSDAVSGAKELRMLGLDGIYAQILVENIPAVRGLGNTFGMNYIPGPWMSSIQVNKGVGSVVNGYESMSGQINVEYKKPQFSEKLFVNLFVNQDVRTELNIITAHKLKQRWSYLGAAHGFYNWLRMDMNHDHFIDNPLVINGNMMHRFSYDNPGKMMFMGAVVVNVEDRVGGSIHFKPRTDEHALHTAWGVRLRTDKVEAFAKTGFTLSNKQGIGIQYKYNYHHQFGNIGFKKYDATEHFGYLNLIFQQGISDKDDLIKAGLSVQVNKVKEVLDSIVLDRFEIVPGFFGETNLNFGRDKQVMLSAGIRADYHNLYGAFASPRVNLKWRVLYGLSFRASAGRGYRVPTVFAENFGWLANNRDVSVQKDLGYEESWNYGASLSYDFDLNFRHGNITIDYFRTDFAKQVVADIEEAGRLSFYSIRNSSFANAVQVELNYEPIKRWEVKLAYKFEQNKVGYTSDKKIFPLKPQHRGLLSMSYATRDDHWRFNTSLNWFGKSRVPDYRLSSDVSYSPYGKNWVQLNVQITYRIKQWEIYIGGENLANMTQKNPIIMSDQPFSNQLDASMIWGPIRGAMAFLGFRWVLM